MAPKDSASAQPTKDLPHGSTAPGQGQARDTHPFRQSLTMANLATHNAYMAASPQGPTPMQRWFVSTDDVVVRGRTMQRGQALVANDSLVAEIDRMLQETSTEVKEEQKDEDS